MSRKLDNRMSRLESAIPTILPVSLLAFADKCGDHEAIPQDTDDGLIAKHLQKHPEDEGREFSFSRIDFVHGKWNENGDWVCDKPDCPQFQTITKSKTTEN